MALEELLVKLTSRLDAAGFKELDRMEKRADRQTRILSNSLRRMFVGVVGTIGAREILDATVKMDSLRTSFAALAGSDVGGAQQLEYLRNETQRLGQDFVTAAEAYKNLFSAGVGAGMNTEQIQQIFSSVLEAGTVLGSSQQQMQGALMALEQMISKGKVSMEELRRQLGNALPGAMQIAAKAMGTTSQGLQEMLESGLDSEIFVTRFANQLHKEFGGKAVEASHTLRAELARLNNAMFDLKASFLDGEAGVAFADTIRQLTKVLSSSELQSSLKGISQFLTFLLENIKPIMAILALLLGNVAIGKIAKGIGGIIGVSGKGLKFVTNLLALTKGMKLLPKIWEIIKLILWALSPLKKIEAFIWLIVGLVALIAKWKDKKEKEEKSVKPNWQLTNDGKNYTDVNPRSIHFMELKSVYTDKDMYKALRFGNKNEFVHKIDRFPKPSPIMYSAPQNNTTTVNITTNNDNPQGIGEAVKTAMLDVFESVRIRNGYPKTDVV